MGPAAPPLARPGDLGEAALEAALEARYPDPENPKERRPLAGFSLTGDRERFALPERGVAHRETTATGQPLPFCRRTGKLWHLECEEGHGALKWIPCAQLDCETCAEVVKRRRGRRMFGRMGGAGVGFWVFTVPRSWHRLLGQSGVRELRRAAIAATIELDRRVFGLTTGAHGYVHPCGDLRPLEWTPHVHVQTPRMGLRPDGSLVELPAFMPEAALDLMRCIWFRVLKALAISLGKQADHDRDRPLIPEHWMEVNVHYRFTRPDAPGQTFHHLAYDGRSFPGWSAGTLEPWLARGTQAGLLAPNSKHPGIEAWRDAIAGDVDRLDALERTAETDPEEQVRQGRACYHCGGKPEVIATLDRGPLIPMLPLVDLAGLDLAAGVVDGIVDHLLGSEAKLSAIPPPPPPRDPADIPF
jgi:hypothetical protein